MANIRIVKIVKTKYGTYSLHFTNPDGRRRRLSVGSDIQLAQRQAIKFTDWLLEGKDPELEIERLNKKEKAKTITVREFFPIFMERHGSRQSKKMQGVYHNSFKNLCRCPDIVNSHINLISKRMVLDYMQLRMKQDSVTAGTVNREAAFVKGMLSRAVEWDILESNQLNGMKLFREAEKREVYLTSEQATLLIRELPSSIANIVEFAIYTGFRKENILNLNIESVRFHDLTPTGEVELFVKGGKKELFPLGKAAVEVLKRVIGKRHEGYVFISSKTGTRYKSIHKTFDRAVRRLGLIVNGTKLRFHDLRHVFATWLHRAGVSLDIIRPLLGHRDRKTTDRYTTIDRLAIGKVLSAIPSIGGENAHKKMAKIV